MATQVLSDELQAQLTAEGEAIYAARCAAYRCAHISPEEGRDAQAVIGALALDFRSARGRKYLTHRRALAATFGSTDLLHLARRAGDHPEVQRSVRAVLRANGMGARHSAAFTRVQAAEDALATASEGPLAAHGEALAALCGTRIIEEAQRRTMRFLEEVGE